MSEEANFSDRLFQPVPIHWLVIYRIAFGMVMCWYAWKFLTTGSVDYFYSVPIVHFPYDGFDWIHLIDSPIQCGGVTYEVIHLEFLILLVTALLIALGLMYRVATVVFAVCFVHVFLSDKCYYQNHYYLVSLLACLLPFLPAHRALSVDVLLFPSLRSLVVPRWTQWLMRFQIGVPYFFGGIAKIDSDWLRGQPMRMSMTAKMDMPYVGGPWMEQEWVVQTFVWGGMLFDLTIVPLLLWKRTRPLAYLLAVGFHLVNSVVWTIGIFPWLMILATTVFFDPDWPRRLFRFIFRSRTNQGVDDVTVRPKRPAALKRNLIVTCLLVFVSFQCLYPLRHLIYPGNSNWDEYTHHFSWHMLLRAKKSGLRLYATDPESGRSGTVDLRSYVTSRQLGVIARDPRMIHQLCQYVAKDLSGRGFDGIEIRALALVSLNGRKPQPMIDPTVDLGNLPLPDSFPDYVMPLKEEFRYSAWGYPLQEWENHLTLDLPPQMQLLPTRSPVRAND